MSVSSLYIFNIEQIFLKVLTFLLTCNVTNFWQVINTQRSVIVTINFILYTLHIYLTN